MAADEVEEEAEMAEQEIEISDEEEEDVEAERAEAARKTARDEERKAAKVKTSKAPLPKDHRSEKTQATPKASTVPQMLTPKGSTPVNRPKPKEPQGSHTKDTKAGKP